MSNQEIPNNVIQMFRRETKPTEPVDPDVLHDLLTPELDESLLDVQVQITYLYESDTVAEFQQRLSDIKAEVAGWPDGHST